MSRLIDGWDEPEPLAEYDPGLRQPRLEIDNVADKGLIGELRIDRWISTIDGTTAIQRERVISLLRRFDDNRLRRWLPWLGKQQWTGDSLVLFLEFRAIWDRRPRWWESNYWDVGLRCWRPASHPGRASLSMDDSYRLVHHRLGCRPSEVIDEAWFEDWSEGWEESALWVREFLSFASFAVFRAGIEPSENWKAHLNWDNLDDTDNDDVDYETDWYDSGEWYEDWRW